VWVNGVLFNVRLEDDRLCTLVTTSPAAVVATPPTLVPYGYVVLPRIFAHPNAP